MNPATDDYEVNEVVDSAFNDRLVHIVVVNHFEDFKSFMMRKYDADTRIDEFIASLENVRKTSGDHVFQKDDIIELPELTPTPRSWERLYKIYRHVDDKFFNEYFLEIARGIVGKEAPMFYSVLDKMRKEAFALSPDDLWRKSVRKLQKTEPALRIAVLDQLKEENIATRDDEELYNFFENLEKGYKTEELNILMRMVVEDKELAEKMEEIKSRDKKLRRAYLKLKAGSDDITNLLDNVDKYY